MVTILLVHGRSLMHLQLCDVCGDVGRWFLDVWSALAGESYHTPLPDGTSWLSGVRGARAEVAARTQRVTQARWL
jgi:hypothetical protein